MSVKVYNGFYIKEQNLSKLKDICLGFQEKLILLAKEHENTFVYNVQKDSQCSEFEAKQKWIKRREKLCFNKEAFDPIVDINFSLIFIPIEGKTLGIVITKQSKWKTEWLNYEGVSEYFYYDNEVKPDFVTEDDWCQRKFDWSVLNNRPLCEQGFEIQLISSNIISTRQLGV